MDYAMWDSRAEVYMGRSISFTGNELKAKMKECKRQEGIEEVRKSIATWRKRVGAVVQLEASSADHLENGLHWSSWTVFFSHLSLKTFIAKIMADIYHGKEPLAWNISEDLISKLRSQRPAEETGCWVVGCSLTGSRGDSPSDTSLSDIQASEPDVITIVSPGFTGLGQSTDPTLYKADIMKYSEESSADRRHDVGSPEPPADVETGRLTIVSTKSQVLLFLACLTVCLSKPYGVGGVFVRLSPQVVLTESWNIGSARAHATRT
ncbi:hypothetical protein ElyMa_005880000 [Elysia marginata]|uniref:Uncharacterized protein n=1 Tax=Elysia marginata TaxID=1093978 RepID=A0AAV4G2Z5_9GAST|nr:hypothetical protein ElyMa_005880000 [Elysia marginata]